MGYDVPVKVIYLTQSKFTIIDDEDYAALSVFKWHYGGRHGYAIRKIRTDGKQSIVWMHREILKLDSGFITDHINGNKLDNRRANLRQCNSSENRQNQRKKYGVSSKYKGVYLVRKTGKWRASIGVYGTRYRLGTFSTEEDAAMAYDQNAKLHFGEFAATNF